ncbi:AfsR/SARP family transcriptional regulator [Streptomyces brevispora]|uniref:AfsR/SARP family transcriptional regulator n=1 Tax=Streptomyces brevispora TaxID=887462 RepID=A0A561TYJ8_9ACTN|nr:AfsR/SARP family transcriptional regulator [Streptomyces brevispora]TWF92174.1 DNA-binding SARP family transcriptional activator [Streptomyces brevispora]WSC11525.1 AfsR/SARP family transcriptional regulator [Streptomyces brevispora]WSC17586.1 AfsR/SARP family transcriptional regulator [Streptomyces brevispora]
MSEGPKRYDPVNVGQQPGQLSVRLLGSLSLHLDETPVTASAPKQRQVLALLALNAGRIVTVPALIEELWADRPPRSHATTLQTYVLQLRNALAAADADRPGVRQILRTRHGGYLLEGDACTTDVSVFENRVRAGRAASEAGDHRRASEELRQALQLWRGPALVDVRKGSVLEIEAVSLEESRLGALERRIESDLALGRHAGLLGELTRVVARNTMNENLCAFLMIALYRAGRVGRSLEAFHRLRSVLNHELGVEPCPRLQNLQSAILSGDPDLDVWTVSWSPEEFAAHRLARVS